MFICLDCGHIFDEDEVYKWEESHGLDTPPYEKWSGCPRCQGDYAEVYTCDCCNEWIEGAYIKLENGDRICENCYTMYDIGDE